MSKYITITLSLPQANALMAALDGFEPDTANYDGDEPASMGWSPEDVDNLDSATDLLSSAITDALGNILAAERPRYSR